MFSVGQIVSLDPDLILVSPYQLREDYGDLEELLSNILENGQQIPIRVWFSPSQDGYFSNDNGKYHAYCHDGNRRLHAARLGKARGLLPKDYSLQALVIPEIVSEKEALVNQFTLNNTGRPFSATETAKLCKRLQELGSTQKEIAQKLGRSQPWVSNILKLLTLGQETEALLESGTPYSSVLKRERRSRKKKPQASSEAPEASSEAPNEASSVDIWDPTVVSKLNLPAVLDLLLQNSHSLKAVGEKELSIVVPKLLFNRLEDLVLGD